MGTIGPPAPGDSHHVSPLEDQLRAAIRRHPDLSGRGFIPVDEINVLVSREGIEDSLKRVSALHPLSRRLLVDQILGSTNAKDPQSARYVKVFAILALVGHTASILDFAEHKASDEELPLTFKAGEGDRGLAVYTRQGQDLNFAPGSLENWTTADIDSFEEQQWLVLAPVFLKDAVSGPAGHLELPPKAVLPFVEIESSARVPQRHGGSATISYVKVHPAHYNFAGHQDRNHHFAVKVLASSKKAEFRRELQMMKKFGSSYSDNVVQLLAAWQQNDSFFMLLPWAEGDLRTWWRDHPNQITRSGSEHAHWLLNCCRDVASGLAAIHQNHFSTSGYHGDIKPENILWFPDPSSSSSKGTWKITDFGLSATLKDDMPQTPGRFGCTPSYRAPEYDNLERNIGQKADIWSLGCVFLECAIWFLQGYRGLKDFESRRFGKNSHDKSDGAFWEQCFFGNMGKQVQSVILKPLVSEWLHDLESDTWSLGGEFAKYLNAFIVMIRRSMLVIDENERIQSESIASELCRLSELSPDLSPGRLLENSKTLDLRLDTLTSVSPGSSDRPCTQPITAVPALPDSIAPQALALANTVHEEQTSVLDPYLSTASDSVRHPSQALEHLPPNYHTAPAPSLSIESSKTKSQTSRSPRGRKRACESLPANERNSHSSKICRVEQRRFGCPFNKRDPATFGIHDSRWRACVGPGWTSVHRVKEHIDRKHSLAPNTCPRCTQHFATARDLNHHQRSEPPCLKSDPGGMTDYRITEAQRTQMRRRPKGRSDVDAWNDLYRIIFGLSSTDPVPAPYCDSSAFPVQLTDVEPALAAERLPAKFEHYLRYDLLPTANAELSTKIQGYFELANMFERSHASSASILTSQPSSVSTLPSLVSEDLLSPDHAGSLHGSVRSLDTGQLPVRGLNSAQCTDWQSVVPTIANCQEPWYQTRLSQEEEDELSAILLKGFDGDGNILHSLDT